MTTSTVAATALVHADASAVLSNRKKANTVLVYDENSFDLIDLLRKSQGFSGVHNLRTAALGEWLNYRTEKD